MTKSNDSLKSIGKREREGKREGGAEGERTGGEGMNERTS